MMLQMALFHSFYGWTVFHCIYTYDIFIHSSVNGYLGCFHIVVIVNTAAMNNGCMYLFEVVFSGYMPRNGIARSFKGASPLNFPGITLVGGGGACNNNRCSPLSISLWLEAAISDPTTDCWYLGKKVLFAYSVSSSSMKAAQRWQKRMAAILHLSLFLAAQAFNSSIIPKQLHQILLSRWGDRLLMLPTPASQNPL